jgi:hypothetical protein
MTDSYNAPVPKFSLGQIVATPHVLAAVQSEEILNALSRHARGDWGDVSADDKAANDWALLSGGRLHSVYHDRKGVKFWILTEADRNTTTVLLPDDY